MHTIYLDASEYAGAAEVHAALKRLLDLPEYYGMNADALHDCLSERTEKVNLYIRGQGTPEAEETLRKVCCVVEDLDGDVRRA